jgi:hypothetical protein
MGMQMHLCRCCGKAHHPWACPVMRPHDAPHSSPGGGPVLRTGRPLGPGSCCCTGWAGTPACNSGGRGLSRPSASHLGHTSLGMLCSPTCWLSLRMTIMFLSRNPAWFMASYAMPPVMAPSPITAMTCRDRVRVVFVSNRVTMMAHQQAKHVGSCAHLRCSSCP